MHAPVKRLREIDFLRGVAILLVLCRHQYLSDLTTTIGWAGVDLFFVLSGFLVSGLLFKEYIRFGDIQPKRFLIGRGFKIYPIYYIFYPVFLMPLLFRDGFYWSGIFSELLFIQNYTMEWGYAFVPGWSLAVEEHFYIGLSVFLWLCIKKNLINLHAEEDQSGMSRFELLLLSIMGLSLILRISSSLLYPDKLVQVMTMTHFRVDSLIAGVFISYLYNFRLTRLKNVYTTYRTYLFIMALIGLSWVPFLDPWDSVFLRTIGYTLVYISFGILLLTFLLTKDINQKIDRLFTAAGVNIMSKIGFCSYSIYVIHAFVNTSLEYVLLSLQLNLHHYILFPLSAGISVAAGMLMTFKIEHYFLRIRDKYYPHRAAETVVVAAVKVLA